jgi:hypothetical protein
MRAHDKAEDLWHWFYRVSRRFDAPSTPIGYEERYYPLEVVPSNVDKLSPDDLAQQKPT